MDSVDDNASTQSSFAVNVDEQRCGATTTSLSSAANFDCLIVHHEN